MFVSNRQYMLKDTVISLAHTTDNWKMPNTFSSPSITLLFDGNPQNEIHLLKNHIILLPSVCYCFVILYRNFFVWGFVFPLKNTKTKNKNLWLFDPNLYRMFLSLRWNSHNWEEQKRLFQADYWLHLLGNSSNVNLNNWLQKFSTCR